MFVVAFPLKAALSLCAGSFSTTGFALSNVTVPGPRYFDQVRVTGGRGVVRGAFVPLVYFMSSATHRVSSSGEAAEAVRVAAFARVATGPWIAGPFCSNRITGGVLLTAISLNGLMT